MSLGCLLFCAMATDTLDGTSPLDAARAIMRETVLAGATRHVTAAVAATLFRLLQNWCDDDEVSARLDAIVPVIQEKVTAAREVRKPVISGGKRAKRNLAEHNGFGEGANFMQPSDAEAKAKQRGRRRDVDVSKVTGPSLKRSPRLAATRLP